jgi:hypothetical protein
MIEVQKRKIKRTGSCGEAYFAGYGYGYQRDKCTVTKEMWCVVEGDKVIAECRSKAIAERIALALSTPQQVYA